MNIYETLSVIIDLRSFSSLWYWIVVAVFWSTASYYVIGVPFDLAMRAVDQGGQKMQDVEDLVRINVNRIIAIAEITGLFSVALASAVLTILFALSVFYGIEFAQALLFLAAPMTLISLMSIATARDIHASAPTGAHLVQRLKKHRFKTQVIGIFSIFVTAMWGMYSTIATGPLGGL